MITPELHAEIRRLYFGEHWKVGTIAAALGVHHDTVRAALAHDTRALPRGRCRPTQLDPYLPFVRDTLAQYPRLRATRLFEMVRARGYPGSVVQLCRVARTLLIPSQARSDHSGQLFISAVHPVSRVSGDELAGSEWIRKRPSGATSYWNPLSAAPIMRV